MNAAKSLHPTDQALSSYGLGKLDEKTSEEVGQHLEQCLECRRRVGELSPDSFLDRIRRAQPGSNRSVAGASLVDGTFSLASSKNAAPPPSTDSLPPGLAEHSDYQIKRELGRGGMGVVYLAHNTLMGRDEVLKVIGREIMERPGVLDRFQREIRAVAKLHHENIVTAYTAFRIEGGLVFAMEYVEGLNLARLVKVKGPMAVPHAAFFAYQTALGLQHAHDRGMVHRDIKPHNLMLTHDRKARIIKILDFGLAKATREQKLDTALTHEGQALGTPDYIAPEQILNATDVDIRADLYSLGGTLYFLLTGHPPFSASSLYDIYQAHISRDADPLNLVRPEVPAELAALVAKLMAKDPRRRFQTPSEAAEALKPFFKKGQTPIVKEPVPVPVPDQKPNVAPPTSTPTPRTDAEESKTEQPHHSALSKSLWECPVKIVETISLFDTEPSAPRPRCLTTRWAALTAGLLLSGLLAAWWMGVFRARTPYGDLVFENLPSAAIVTVDGHVTTVEWPEGMGVGRIKASAGDHQVRVELDGLEVYGNRVTIAAGDQKPIIIHLDATPTPQPVPVVDPEHLVAFFGFDEGKALDISGKGHQGTLGPNPNAVLSKEGENHLLYISKDGVQSL